MGIRLVTFYNSTVTPQDDALIYENALPASGMIYGGNVTIKNANTLHISAGHGALCGRKFTIEEDDIPIILTSSGTLNGRLYIHMDLSDTGEPISLEVERANVLTPVVQQSNVNINDGIYEINLATFTISTSTVSDLNYVAPFIRDLDAREVIIAPVEPTNIASSNYAIGRRLILNKVLYRVTATITAGQTITPGTNVTESNSVEEQIEANLSSINTINSNKLNQSVIATRQSNLIASKDYVIGEQFVYNNILYKATAAIARNATITIGGNATTADSISSQISNLVNAFTYLTKNEIFDSTNASVTSSYAVKQSRIVNLTITFANYQLTQNVWTVLGTLKSKFRPTFQQDFNAVSNTDGRSFQARITATGIIQIWVPSTITHSPIVSLTYIAANSDH